MQTLSSHKVKTVRTSITAALSLTLAACLYAQSPEDAKHITPPLPVKPEAITPETAKVTAGPTIYVTDSAGHLATVVLGTYKVKIIGKEGVLLTDIAFNPKDGNLYGITFSHLYKVSKTTGKATAIGSLGVSDANALVFDGQGVAYSAGVNNAKLYTINIKTGKATTVGSTSPYKSDGDLTFHHGGLLLSGYEGSLTSTTPTTLVTLNYKTGKVESHSATKIPNIFGIVCTSLNDLYGFSGTNLYQLNPSESSETKRAILLKDLKNDGLAQIYGAAYDGYFLY